ncbi:MAG: DUF975 family protein [Lachnospiraceae bacterium]|nr:DUF975 family protein [Lachnospiraceae bacterium]
MKRTCKELKRLSRKNLLGNYGGAMLAMLIVSLIQTIVMSPFENQISSYQRNIALGTANSASVTMTYNTFPVFAFIGIIIVGLVATILQGGLISYHLKLSRGGEKPSLSMVFSQFKHRPDRYIVATLLMILIIFACMVPGIVLITVASTTPALGGGLVFPGIFLLIAGYVLIIWLSLRFTLIYAILADHPECGAVESMKQSFSMMKGNCGRALYIVFSFIPMALLVLLSLGIAELWVSPYITNVNTMFYLDVCGELDFKEEERRRMDEEMGPVLSDEEF